MQAPEPIMEVWRQVDHVLAETLTYQWWRRTAAGSQRQRTVPQMEAHHAAYGSGGDAFDLAIWLLAKFQAAGILADPVAPPSDIDPDKTSDEIAIVAKDRFGRRYFCDLGRQWVQPILVSRRNPDFTSEFLAGFDPVADVSVTIVEKRCSITRRVPAAQSADKGDKAFTIEERVFDLRGIPPEELIERAENASSRSPRLPWIRRRRKHPEIGEWGVWSWTPEGAGWQLPSGFVGEPMSASADNPDDLAAELAGRSGLAPEIILAALAGWAEANAS